jgi:hypothetical protein
VSGQPIDLINASLIEQAVRPPVEASCFFRVNPGKVMSKTVDVKLFSLLIDEKQAMLNFSFYAGLQYPHEHDQLSAMIYFQLDGGSSNAKQSILGQCLFEHSYLSVIFSFRLFRTDQESVALRISFDHQTDPSQNKTAYPLDLLFH